MKHSIIKLLISILITFTLLPKLNADTEATYTNSVTFANNYIKGFTNYSVYIVNYASYNKFKYVNGTLSVDTSLTSGGFLNKSEFDIIGGVNSYLFDGQNYWTMTASGSSYYFINKLTVTKLGTQATTSKTGVRITQYVKNEAAVNGAGTFTDPWVFVQ